MLASSNQLNRVAALVWELHELVGRSCTEVTRLLLSTSTLTRLGYDGVSEPVLNGGGQVEGHYVSPPTVMQSVSAKRGR